MSLQTTQNTKDYGMSELEKLVADELDAMVTGKVAIKESDEGIQERFTAWLLRRQPHERQRILDEIRMRTDQEPGNSKPRRGASLKNGNKTEAARPEPAKPESPQRLVLREDGLKAVRPRGPADDTGTTVDTAKIGRRRSKAVKAVDLCANKRNGNGKVRPKSGAKTNVKHSAKPVPNKSSGEA